MPRSTLSPQHRRLMAVLRRLRTEAGLTQTELAEQLGRPQSYVSKYETGERRLDLIELEEIGEALGVRLVDVVREYKGAR